MHVLKLIELYPQKGEFYYLQILKELHLFISYYVPGAYHDYFILIFIITPQNRYYYYIPYFTNKETEVQIG